MLESQRFEEIREQLGDNMRAILLKLAEIDSGVLATQICTSDGFEVATVHRDEESHRRLAAMVSSLHAVGSAMVLEAELGHYSNLIIEATEGKCLMMAIPGSSDSLLLVAVASPDLLFGMFHQSCNRACEQLGKLLTA